MISQLTAHRRTFMLSRRRFISKPRNFGWIDLQLVTTILRSFHTNWAILLPGNKVFAWRKSLVPMMLSIWRFPESFWSIPLEFPYTSKRFENTTRFILYSKGILEQKHYLLIYNIPYYINTPTQWWQLEKKAPSLASDYDV